MQTTTPRSVTEAALEKVNAILAVSPDSVEMCFNRGCLLTELGRIEDAKLAYIELLKMAPTHFGALNNLGNLLYSTGFKTAARMLYAEAVAQHPDNPKAHYNLADVLFKNSEMEEAIKHYEIVLKIDPNHAKAHQGMAYALTEMGDEKRAALHRQKGFGQQPVMLLPYYGEGEPIRVLLLASAVGGTVPIQHQVDTRIFQGTILFVEFWDLTSPLPLHDFVFNTIGDADLCRPALEVAIKIVAQTSAPVLNQPARVLPTGRAENAAQLAKIPGIIAPKISLLPRALLERADAPALLAKEGFTFPLLLRSPGFHTGRFFIRVEDEQALKTHLPSMPGEELLVLQYIDARKPDGKIRKYRIMMIDGVLYPLHAAISHEWKIHYFTAEMADNPEHRAEDAAFLENMPQVLGPRAMRALEQIRDTLGLDYGGIDFSLNAEGDVILFEANATMVVHPPDKDERWDYRRPAAQKVLDAIRHLLTKHTATQNRSLPPLGELLASGGDARLLHDRNDVNKYGCYSIPRPEFLSYSSSTASTISPKGFAASAQLYARLEKASRTEAAAVTYAREMERVRSEFSALCDLTSLKGIEIIFGASGTDLHIFAAQLLTRAESPLRIIMPEASETGSGVKMALEGKHFSTQTALGSVTIPDKPITDSGITDVVVVQSREADGSLRSQSAIDSETEAVVTHAVAAKQHVVLVVIDVSKTGLIAPSIACALALKRRFPEWLDILVDACQFRLANATLRAYLQQECIVMVTGSKFVTGPAFCGILLMPPAAVQRLRAHPFPVSLSAYSTHGDWPQGWAASSLLAATPNYGLLLRFEAALAELRAFRALPEAQVQGFLEQFSATIQQRLSSDAMFELLRPRAIDRQSLVGSGGWDTVPTIFPFLLRHRKTSAVFSQQETTRMYELMKQDLSNNADIPGALQPVVAQLCLLGQPVSCGMREALPLSALRLSCDMRLIVDALSPRGRGREAIIKDALSVLDKLAVLAEYLF